MESMKGYIGLAEAALPDGTQWGRASGRPFVHVLCAKRSVSGLLKRASELRWEEGRRQAVNGSS